MKKLFYFTLLLLCNVSFSQKKQIEIFDAKDKMPLRDVLLYDSESIIGRTDGKGIVEVNMKKINEVTVVKEDYYDTIIKTAQFNGNKIYLSKIEGIKLAEIVIVKNSITSILDSVYKRSLSLRNVNQPSSFHVYNLLKADRDTLLFLNNRFHLMKQRGYFAEKCNAIISKFQLVQGKPVFLYKESTLIFNKSLTHSNSPINSSELQLISKFRDGFNFKVSEDTNLYKIEFSPKKDNTEYPYVGFLIVDKIDLGIYEFKSELYTTGKQVKRSVAYNSQILNFEILKESCYIKYDRNDSGTYDLVMYASDSELRALNGAFKNDVFYNKCRKEVTPDFATSQTALFDFMSYKFL
ncbi:MULTISPECIES: hypothetical protein [Flavobacterium]|uniref:hypothetical protein n=1 Tax=Flavobacterium TaxID=237 RepID=UPI001FCABBE6|nr:MULTISPECIES: hypothetical protein [Flavobacterium]UOK43661.1 hypothetical protein LZF87_05965 [Flavobacterium enshiense]